MSRPYYRSIVYSILAAAMYSISAPLSKVLLQNVAPTVMASLLYLGGGIGMFGLSLLRGQSTEIPLSKKELPYTILMILLDILAPILMMIGLGLTSAANASLLNNFEIVATALIASLLFKEMISKRLWLAIFFITVACLLLTFQNGESLQFSVGSLFILGAALAWGLENNCTRMMSAKDPVQIVILKGFGSGFGSLLVSIFLKAAFPDLKYILFALVLGFFAYGLSIYLYVHAQRHLGAARTSAYYAVGPFIGVLFSFFIFREVPGLLFWIALLFMAVGAYLAAKNE
ncbi:MAG: DMT family transporter [Clostridiaceae bacterium]